MEEYSTPNSKNSISRNELQKADRETQLEVMEGHFREHFEDPAENMPYETAEGGYQWIWGGPYDAHEELENMFSGVVPGDVIEELAENLNGECPDWAPTYSDDAYDNYLALDIARITEFYQNFSGAITDIETLLKLKVDSTGRDCFRRMIYVNVISALETYLSDAFISTVLNNPELIQRFVETTPKFKTEKVTFSKVFKAVLSAKPRVQAYLVNVVWHRLKKVKQMYYETLDIDFPSDLETIISAIQTRHDIVHRNGKTNDGKIITISIERVENLICSVEEFVKHIDTQFTKE